MSHQKTWLTGLTLFVIGSIGWTRAQQDDQQVHDVIVIGAGLAGLSAANRILDQSPSTDVLVLEARNSSGGRVMAHQMNTPDGPRFIDIGSQFVSLKHRGILDLALQFGLTVEEQPICGERTVLQGAAQPTLTSTFRRRKRSYKWTDALGGTPSIDTVLSSNDLDSLALQSCAKFIQANNLDKSDGDGMKRLLQTFYDAPDTTVSALQVLLTASSEGGSVDDILSEMGHGNGLRIKEGLTALIDQLSMRNGLQISYSTPVTAVTQVNPSVQSVTANGKQYFARQVIIAVPPAVAANIDLSPVMPQKMTDFLREYRPRGFATYFALTYAKPFWRENGNNGQIIYSGTANDLLWATTFDTSENNLCGNDGVPGVLWGIAHFKSEKVTREQRQIGYRELIEMAFPSAPEPLDISDYQFYKDPYSLGSIGVLPVLKDASSTLSLLGALSTDDETPYSEQRRKRFSLQSPSVHFTSAELSKQSMGMMNGAVLHGQLVAESVLKQLAANPSPSASNGRSASPKPYFAPNHDEPAASTMKPEGSSLLYPDDLMNDKGTTTFVYQTSPQYPTTETNSQSPVSKTVKYDFVYATSPMYPDLLTTDLSTTAKEAEEVKTTTLDYTAEFLGSSTKRSSSTTTTTESTTTKAKASSILYPDDLMNDKATTQFAYATSPQYESSTQETPKPTTSQEKYDFPYTTSSQYPEYATTPFVYETSSQYPASSSETPVTAPYKPAYDFPYSTSTQYPSDFYPVQPTTSASYDQGETTEAAENTTSPASPSKGPSLVDTVIELLNPNAPTNATISPNETNETSPGNETSTATKSPLTPDLVLDLLNPEANLTTTEEPKNGTSPVDTVLDLLNPKAPLDNGTTPLDSILDLLNPTKPGSVVDEGRNGTIDEVIALLNPKVSENHTVEASTIASIDVILDLFNPKAPENENDTESSGITAIDAVIHLLQPASTKAPENETDLNPSPPANATESPPTSIDAVIDLLNPKAPTNESTPEEPKNVTQAIDELLNLLNPTPTSSKPSPFDAILGLLNPKAPENGTETGEANNGTTPINWILNLLNPKAPENITASEEKTTQAPKPDLALFDLVLQLLNPTSPTPSNATSPQIANVTEPEPLNTTTIANATTEASQPDSAAQLLSTGDEATNTTLPAESSNGTTTETAQEIVQDAVKQVEQNIQKIPLSNRKPLAGRLANVLASLLNLVRRR